MQQRRQKPKKLEGDLPQRVSEVFSDERVRPAQTYKGIIKSACAMKGLDITPDHAERLVWRARGDGRSESLRVSTTSEFIMVAVFAARTASRAPAPESAAALV